MIIAGFELPDKCPVDCPFNGHFYQYGQGAICIRCPVIICKKDDDGFCMVEPEDYRPDWAEEWSVWFAGPKDTYPELYFEVKKK